MIADPNANLSGMLAPRSVAVIGATERSGSVGRAVFERLTTRGFTGGVFPVTPAHAHVLGRKTFASIGDVGEPVDLAVIVTPAASVPDIVAQCARAGVKGVVIISAGFREAGPEGAQLERRALALAQAAGMRIIGPNCLGLIIPSIGLDVTFAAATALPGSIGFVSQSGALCTAILDWAASRNVGFSHFFSAGSMVDVGWADYLDYLVDDPATTSILLYMESVGDHPSSFVSSARQAASLKPLIVMKSGRTEVAARAAVSHTGALLGSDDVFDAALRRCGALRVDRIQDLFDMAEVLAKGKRPRGKRLAIVTNAGGPGVIAADALIAAGGELSALAPQTRSALDAMLPAHWSRANPIDILGDADPARYVSAVDAALADPNSDAVLVIYAPQAVASAGAVAQAISGSAAGAKPVLAAWMGGSGVTDGRTVLDRAGISTYPYPELAVDAFDYLWRYDENLTALYETPVPTGDDIVDAGAAIHTVDSAIADGRVALTPTECSRLAAAYGIPLVPSVDASTADEAVAAAEACGYPVAVKVRSKIVTHKSDVGGVRLDVTSARGVREAFDAIASSVTARAGAAAFGGVIVQPMAASNDGLELILGSTSDPQFGPVVVFGLGGTLVEVFRDRGIGLPPLNGTLARLLMESTRAFGALRAVRGRDAVDIDALAALLVRFSRLVTEVPRIREIDINPLFVSPKKILALDMRVLLHGPEVTRDELPRPAIRPYPSQYAGTWTASDGTLVDVRPIRAEDEPLVREFHRCLSDATVYMRFAHVERLEGRIAHARLARACFIDYGREIALIALAGSAQGPRVLGIANLVRTRLRGQAEFALLVADRSQHHGVGSELLRRLVAIGKEEGVSEIVGYVLESNAPMLAICKRLGFTAHGRVGDSVVKTTLDPR